VLIYVKSYPTMKFCRSPNHHDVFFIQWSTKRAILHNESE